MTGVALAPTFHVLRFTAGEPLAWDRSRPVDAGTCDEAARLAVMEDDDVAWGDGELVHVAVARSRQGEAARFFQVRLRVTYEAYASSLSGDEAAALVPAPLIAPARRRTRRPLPVVGDFVEFLGEAVRDGAWTGGTYNGPVPELRGWHYVTNNGGTRCMVPSRRLRAVEASR